MRCAPDEIRKVSTSSGFAQTSICSACTWWKPLTSPAVGGVESAETKAWKLVGAICRRAICRRHSFEHSFISCAILWKVPRSTLFKPEPRCASSARQTGLPIHDRSLESSLFDGFDRSFNVLTGGARLPPAHDDDETSTRRGNLRVRRRRD